MTFEKHTIGAKIFGYSAMIAGKRVGYIRKDSATRIWITTCGLEEVAHANTLADAKRQAPSVLRA